MPISCCRTRPISNAGTASRCSTGRSRDADGAADAIRQPVVQPDRDVRPFQDVLLDLGARLGLPGMVDRGRRAANIPGGYARLYRQSRAHARHRPARRLARRGRRRASGAARANPNQLDAYVANGCFWRHELATDAALLSSIANRAYLDWAARMGFIAERRADRPAALFRAAAEIPPRRARATAPIAAAGAACAQRIDDAFRSAADLVRAVRGSAGRPRRRSRCTRSPSGRWRCTIPGARRMRGCARSSAATSSMSHRATARGARASPTTTGSWVTSHNGAIKVQIKLMDGVNPDTVWTWNAIGKRAGAWNLAPDAPEATQGFLLNHLISELLPQDARPAPFANADPVTGQAAWYDLRVRLEKVRPPTSGDAPSRNSRRCHAAGPAGPPATARYGAEFRPARATGDDQPVPANTGAKRLGLVIDLDTCVGCHACATNCKEWNTGGDAGAADRHQRLSGRAARGLVQPRVQLRGRRRRGRPHRAFPEELPALREARLRHRLSDRRLLQARRGRHRADRRRHLHRLQAVLLGLPLWRARVRRGRSA